MNTIVIFMDSLNRDYLSCYGNKWVKTPNIDRLANKSMCFDNHFAGSLPCIPARREIFTGRQIFMWTGWGQAECYDTILAKKLKQNKVYSAMITDHMHYWDASKGYGYIEQFHDLKMLNGCETENSAVKPLTNETPDWVDAVSKYRSQNEAEQFYRNLCERESNEDFPSVKVMDFSAKWLEDNSHQENFFLMIEAFDPHEPFFSSDDYNSMYGEYSQEYTFWPPYQQKKGIEKFHNETSKEEIEFIRQQYASGITMVDAYLGRVFDVMDEKNMWKNTRVILTTDHGHDLYEHETYGKSYPHWNTHSNLPLIIYSPEMQGASRSKAYTTTVDLCSTIYDSLGLECETPHGRTLMPIVEKKTDTHRKGVIYGVFGTGVCYCDEKYTFFSGYDNTKELNWYSGHLECHPKFAPNFEEATSGKFIPNVNVPVWKIPGKSRFPMEKVKPMLFLRSDTEQKNNIVETDKNGVEYCKKRIIEILDEQGTPNEQYGRLGLR